MLETRTQEKSLNTTQLLSAEDEGLASELILPESCFLDATYQGSMGSYLGNVVKTATAIYKTLIVLNAASRARYKPSLGPQFLV